MLTLTDAEAETVMRALWDAQSYRTYKSTLWAPDHRQACPEPCATETADYDAASEYQSLAERITARRQNGGTP